jgi:hypothetical protein
MNTIVDGGMADVCMVASWIALPLVEARRRGKAGHGIEPDLHGTTATSSSAS